MLKLLRLLLLWIVLLGLSFKGSAQVVYNFTTSGATGSQGPTQAQVNASYGAGNTLNNKVTINTQGIQEWVVPVTGPYRLTLLGSSGGSNGGYGASITGELNLTQGHLIKIVVGQIGLGLGGGGGSFVYNATTTTLLMAAGGGGAGFNDANTQGQATSAGRDGTATGVYGNPYAGRAGINGGGGGAGSASDNSTSGGIGGNGTDGGNTQGNSANAGAGGAGFLGKGGNTANNSLTGGDKWPTLLGGNFNGGFGGGGGGRNGTVGGGGFGGGGGYSGGGGGGWTNGWSTAYGGGGGSFNSGTNQNNFAGVQSGDGAVTITLLYFTSISETTFVSCNGAADATVAATVNGGVPPYIYAWNTGATSATLTNVPAGEYTVTVTDANSLTTSATYTVQNPVSLTAQPVAQTATIGDQVTFAAAASGTNLTYIWQVNDGLGFINAPEDANHIGVRTPTLTINTESYQNNFRYRLGVYHNACLPVFSNAATLTLNKKANTIGNLANSATVTYGDAAYSLSATSTHNAVPLVYSVLAGDAVTITSGGLVQVAKSGTAVINVSQAADNNYEAASASQTITVVAKPITATLEAQQKTYGDADPTFTYTFTPSLVGTDTFTGNATRTTGENVGAYSMNQGSLTLGNNYNLTVVPATLTINAKAITITANASSKTYGDAEPTLTFGFAPSLAFADTFTGNVARVAGENVGTYTIAQGTLAVNNNYVLTVVPATLTINGKAVTATANAASKTYGDADPALTYNFSPALVGSDTFTGNLTRAAGENVNAYAITQGTLALSPNYLLTVVPATLTINEKGITVTATAQSKVYGAADPALTYNYSPALVGTDTFTGNLTRTAGDNADTYAITQGTLGLSNNYNLSVVPATLTISTQAVTVTAQAQSKTYGNADPALTYTFSPALVGSDTFTGNLARIAGENVGDYTINQGSLALTGNYALQVVSSTLTINTKAVTATAQAQSKTYGDADPALTFQVNPTLAFNDTFTGNLSRVAGNNVGSYAINRGSLALNNNYVVTYVGANLVINPKALTITADAKIRLQGVANPTLTASYAGFINGENNTNALSTQPVLATTATMASPQGIYPITVSGAVAVNSNYAITYVNGTLTVTPGFPTALTLAPATLFENRPVGTLAATLSSNAPDPNAVFTYSLVGGAGSADNAKFTISGNQLLTATVLDYEAQSVLNIRVRTTTQYGLSLEQTFTINVQDVNEVPTMDAVAAQTICYTTTAQTVALSGITAGPETAQSVTISVSSNNPSLFSALSVTIGNGTAGTFRYTINNNAIGTALVTLTVRDNGGVANGGADTYTRTFNVTVNPLPVVSISSSVPSNSVSRGETLQLMASAPGAVSYSWANANGIISGQNSANLSIKPTQTTTYTVTALNGTGCSDVKQITIEVRNDFQAVKPNNIITPNGDGANDTWFITNIDQYPNAEVRVFDRAGRLVFAKKGYDNSWNGTYNGAELAQGAYMYVIDFGQGLYKAKGTVTLLRNQ